MKATGRMPRLADGGRRRGRLGALGLWVGRPRAHRHVEPVLLPVILCLAGRAAWWSPRGLLRVLPSARLPTTDVAVAVQSWVDRTSATNASTRRVISSTCMARIASRSVPLW